MFAVLPALALFAFVSSITPGPNNFMLMSSGVNFGFRRTIPHFLGVGLGVAVMILLIGLGLAQLFVRFPPLLLVLKWGGAAYLIFLAYKIARSAPPQAGQAPAQPFTFVQAAAFQWVNPKAWIMAVTACATYTDQAHATASAALIAAVFGTVNLPCLAVWIGGGMTLRAFLSDPKMLKIFNVSVAMLLVASLYPVLRDANALRPHPCPQGVAGPSCHE